MQVTELPRAGWRERVAWYEDLGFSAIHTPDHFDMRQLDPLTAQAAMGAVARRAAVGATVLDVSFYHPLVLARAAATIASLSAGGFELGIGAGWMPDDYELAGLPFDRPGVRLDRLREVAEIVRSVWTQETTTFEGEHYRIREAPAVAELPLAVMPRILIGGTMPRAVRLAGVHADIVSVFPALPSGTIGWPGWAAGSTIEYFAEKAAWAQQGASRAGRDFGQIELSTQLTHTAVAEDHSGLQEFLRQSTGVEPRAQDDAMIFLTGTPALARERLQRRRRAATGVSYYVMFDPVCNYRPPGRRPRSAW